MEVSLKRLLCFAALVLVAGCATPIQHQTASGKPEVTIDTGNVTAVKEALVARMVNNGWNLVRDSDYLMVFERPVDSVWMAALLGSRYDGTPNARTSYTFAVGGRTVRIVADLAVITNPGSAYERRTDFNQSQPSLDLQRMLNQLRDGFSIAVAY